MKVLLWIVIAIMNLLSYLLMGLDKRAAQDGRWRIPEKTLFLVTALFGGLGGTLGMYAFRHKTKHWYFKVFFPLLLIVQIVILAMLFGVKL